MSISNAAARDGVLPRVLVVEDLLAIADSVGQILQDLGCLIIGPAPDASSALELIKGGQLEGALLDFELDGETTGQIAAELERRNIPFLFLTGYPEARLPVAYRNRCLEKPVCPQILRDRITALLKRG